jgi:hypothetical protein
MMIHVMRDGQQFGPYTLEDVNAYLAQGTLLPADQAWYEGAPDWMLLTQVPGVLSLGAAPVPAAVPAAVVPVAVDPMAAANPAVAAADAAVISAANQGSKKKKTLVIVGSAAGVLAIAGVLCFVYPGFLKDDAESGGDQSGGGSGSESGGGSGSGGGGTFAAVVQPILQKSTCYDCHDGSDGAKVKGKFNLMDPESVKKMVTAGDDVNSEFIGRLTDASDPMPPEGKGDMLSTDDVAKIKAWINAGAKF